MTNSFLTAIETGLVKVWGDLEQIAENEVTAVVKLFTGLATQLLPAQWSILQELVATANKDVQNGDYADLVTDVLNQAEALEIAWVSTLSSSFLTSVVATIHTSQTVAPVPAAAPPVQANEGA